MIYALSEQNVINKIKYEKQIKQSNDRWFEISHQIKNIRNSNEVSGLEKQIKILELQIEQEEIETEVTTSEQAIADLYVREMKSNLINKSKSKEISSQEFYDEMNDIKDYQIMLESKNTIEDFENESEILKQKIRLELMKKNAGIISKEQAEKNISKLKKALDDNEEYKSEEYKELSKKNFEYKKRKLYMQKAKGEISDEKLKEKLEELKQKGLEVPTDEELKEMLENLNDKYLEPKLTSRDEYSTAEILYNLESQDIDSAHEEIIYRQAQEYKSKTFKYGMNQPEGVDYIEYIGQKLGEDYSRGLKGDKVELSKFFASLEVQGDFGEYKDPYKYGEVVDGNENPKYLLELEKVSGLNIEELEDAIGLDTSTLHQDIYIATYEIEEWDSKLQKNMMKPIKEYYQKNKDGEMVMIGSSTENEAKISVDGLEFKLQPNQLESEGTIEKVTQKQMSDKLVKDSIEDSMKNGKVTEVAKITDSKFLKDFAEQCGLPENWDLSNKVFLVATVNEKGDEDFDILIRNDDAAETKYEHLNGVEATEREDRAFYVATGKSLPTGEKELAQVRSLKEFRTKNGNSYAITRDTDGKLNLNELFRENENFIKGQKVDVYTYSANDFLQENYKTAELEQDDLRTAYDTINRTKKDKEMEQNPNKDSESR